MKGIVLSADPTITKWKTLPAKLAFFDRIYNSGKAGKVWEPWTLQTVKVVPKVANGVIDHKWLERLQKPYFTQGYDFVKFHGSMAQAKTWKIKTSLRGANPIDKAEYEVMYFFADENSKRDGLNRFEQTAGHEGGHGYYQETRLTDIVHAWHKANADISGLFKSFNWKLYQPRRMLLKKHKNLLELLLEALRASFAVKAPTELLHPVKDYANYISRGYGVEDKKNYPITGRHIGTDYACPVGTSVLAPWTGEVTVSGFSPSLGNFCYYRYTFENVTYVTRFLHLAEEPVKGKYQRGEVIALSGSSGRVTGPHLHVDIFFNEVRLDLLTAKNWNHLTINPIKHYVTKILT